MVSVFTLFDVLYSIIYRIDMTTKESWPHIDPVGHHIEQDLSDSQERRSGVNDDSEAYCNRVFFAFNLMSTSLNTHF